MGSGCEKEVGGGGGGAKSTSDEMQDCPQYFFRGLNSVDYQNDCCDHPLLEIRFFPDVVEEEDLQCAVYTMKPNGSKHWEVLWVPPHHLMINETSFAGLNGNPYSETFWLHGATIDDNKCVRLIYVGYVNRTIHIRRLTSSDGSDGMSLTLVDENESNPLGITGPIPSIAQSQFCERIPRVGAVTYWYPIEDPFDILRIFFYDPRTKLVRQRFTPILFPLLTNHTPLISPLVSIVFDYIFFDIL